MVKPFSRYLITGLLVVILVLGGQQLLQSSPVPPGSTDPQTTSPFTQRSLNQQGLLGLNWMQQSGEYVALCYQAFHSARLAFDDAQQRQIPHPAVVVDLDETLLDNTPYNASLWATDQGFEGRTWNQWVLRAEAEAIAGAVEFVNYVQAQGGKVFFISNRTDSSTNNRQDNDLEKATLYQLQTLGFQGATDQTVLLKGEYSKVINGRVDTAKTHRRQAITNGDVDGIQHTLVVLVGDNLEDFWEFPQDTNGDRRNYIHRHARQFGFSPATEEEPWKPSFITLPNPLYGSWEELMYQPEAFGKTQWWQLTPDEKNQQRERAIVMPGSSR